MIKSLWYLIQIYYTAAKRLFTERYTYHASALSFTTLLALVPLLSVVASVVAMFPIFDKFIELSRNYIITNFLPTSRYTIEYYLESFIQQATSLSALQIIFLFFITGMLLVTIDHTLNGIWNVPYNKNKYKSWFLYWLVLLFSPFLIGLSVFISTYLFSLPWISTVAVTLGIKERIFTSIPILINTLIFSLLYIVIPRYQVKWRDGISGGFITAILFEISKYGFTLYLKLSPSYELIYGALAIVPIFLVWLYIVWLIILYGALVTHTQYQQRQKKQI